MNISCQAQKGQYNQSDDATEKLFQQTYQQFKIDILIDLKYSWQGSSSREENTIGQFPSDAAVKQLDRFLETLQIMTSCQFGEVTFEGVIKMKIVLEFGL